MTKMNEFERELTERAGRAEQTIRAFLPEETGYQKTVLEAVNYSMNSGGKRLRPVIMREVYDMCGGTDEGAIGSFMAALEMIHTYSLVHDDLPAMDNDDLRRGIPTTHKKYGEAMGILAGDALLNLAYETAFLAFGSSTDPARIAQALQVLGHKAGIYGMVGGQVVDVEQNGNLVDDEMRLFVYETKTSALLEAAFMIGGILAGASEEKAAWLEQAGRNLGLAFQIQDDILDVVGDEERIGKPVHSDEKNKKSTYVLANGLERSRQKVREYTEEALSCLDKFGENKDFLVQLMTSLIDRDR